MYSLYSFARVRDYFNHLYYFLLAPPDEFVNDADECTSLASDLGHLLASEVVCY